MKTKVTIATIILMMGIGAASAQSAATNATPAPAPSSFTFSGPGNSTITIAGLIDIGLKNTDTPAAGSASETVGRGNNNRLIISGTGDPGYGLTPTFGLETRFDPDTGAQESPGTRPFWQGEARVGLRGDFGWVRMGRGFTAVQEPNGAYDPFYTATVATLQGVLTAGFNSDPVQPTGAGAARINNGVFYQSPNMSGTVVRVSYAPTEGAAGYTSVHNGISAEYKEGPLSVLIGRERNSVGNSLTQIAGIYDFKIAALYLGASQQSVTTTNSDRTGLAIGARIPVGTNTLKLGYGTLTTANYLASQSVTDTTLGAGFDFKVSKNGYVYFDIASLKTAVPPTTAINYVQSTSADVGIAFRF